MLTKLKEFEGMTFDQASMETSNSFILALQKNAVEGSKALAAFRSINNPSRSKSVLKAFFLKQKNIEVEA